MRWCCDHPFDDAERRRGLTGVEWSEIRRREVARTRHVGTKNSAANKLARSRQRARLNAGQRPRRQFSDTPSTHKLNTGCRSLGFENHFCVMTLDVSNIIPCLSILTMYSHLPASPLTTFDGDHRIRGHHRRGSLARPFL